jgi:hypothetical protein
VQQHTTPLYNVEAIRYRQEIIATNGEHNTFHAGYSYPNVDPGYSGKFTLVYFIDKRIIYPQ